MSAVSDFRSSIKFLLPPQLRSLLGRLRRRWKATGVYRRPRYAYHDLRDRTVIARSGFPRLPPAALRQQVATAPHLNRFLKIGERCASDLESVLVSIGRPLSSFERVLDFGCGCGRTMIWIARRYPELRLYGTDVDADAIAWCQRNYKFAEFTTNPPLPPSPFDDAAFDLIYLISVFTHLDEDYQSQWLAEIQRISKPGSIVIVMLHGEASQSHLDPHAIDELKKTGFTFVSSPPPGTHPSWYQSAYHTESYVRQHFSRFFTILDYIPRGFNDRHDVVVMQRDAL